MMNYVGGCGCGPVGGGGSYAYPAQSAPVQMPLTYGAAGVTPVGQQGKGKGPGVRDRDRAQSSLLAIQQAVARFADVDAAMAAGYKRNPASGADVVQHLIHDDANRMADASNLALPATLLYSYDTGGKPRLVGVMLTNSANRPLPDFGAGAWHRHPGDENLHMHVWFDRSIDQDAFENNTGYI